jgi:plasmid stability protein
MNQNGCILAPKWLHMANVTIKNLPDELYRDLQLLAKRNQRSLNNQLIVTIQRSLRAENVDPAELRAQARQFRKRLTRGLTPEEISLAINQGRA